MRLAATIILYYPDNQLLSNIQSYISDIEFLLIFDNSPTNAVSSIFENDPKYRYHWDGNNEGIAKRLNQAIEICEKEDVSYLLTMDQDSSFNNNDLKVYKNFVKNEIKHESISMFGIRYYANDDKTENQTIYDKILITSGSIINLKVAISINGFDENLFIDGVDTEFCLKSFKNGFKTVFYQQIYLRHNLGDEKNITIPFLKKRTRKIHNPLRLYYIVRNYLYLRKQYRNLHSKINLPDLINELKNCLFYGGQKIEYLRAILMAIKDANRSQLGKLNNKYAFKLNNRI